MEDPDSKSGIDIDGYGWMTLEKKRAGQARVEKRR